MPLRPICRRRAETGPNIPKDGLTSSYACLPLIRRLAYRRRRRSRERSLHLYRGDPPRSRTNAGEGRIGGFSVSAKDRRLRIQCWRLRSNAEVAAPLQQALPFRSGVSCPWFDVPAYSLTAQGAENRAQLLLSFLPPPACLLDDAWPLQTMLAAARHLKPPIPYGSFHSKSSARKYLVAPGPGQPADHMEMLNYAVMRARDLMSSCVGP